MAEATKVVHVLFVEAQGVEILPHGHSRELNVEGLHRKIGRVLTRTQDRYQALLCSALYFEISYDEVRCCRKHLNVDVCRYIFSRCPYTSSVVSVGREAAVHESQGQVDGTKAVAQVARVVVWGVGQEVVLQRHSFLPGLSAPPFSR